MSIHMKLRSDRIIISLRDKIALSYFVMTISIKLVFTVQLKHLQQKIQKAILSVNLLQAP